MQSSKEKEYSDLVIEKHFIEKILLKKLKTVKIIN